MDSQKEQFKYTNSPLILNDEKYMDEFYKTT